MAQADKAHYLIEIKCANPADFTLGQVVAAPRTCLPVDVKAACDNLVVEPVRELTPGIVPVLVKYLLTDFFQLSHRTGLYNRQKSMWESLSRVTHVEGFQSFQGIFSKTQIPHIELRFNDKDRRTLILADVLEPSAYEAGWQDERRLKDSVRSFQARAERLKTSRGLLTGLFLCLPSPFPEIVLRMIESMTGAADPVGKYESLLPQPLAVPIDLIEYDLEQAGLAPVRLVHPSLTSRSKDHSPSQTAP